MLNGSDAACVAQVGSSWYCDMVVAVMQKGFSLSLHGLRRGVMQTAFQDRQELWGRTHGSTSLGFHCVEDSVTRVLASC